MVIWFQLLLSNTYNSIQYYSFVCTQLNGFKYFNVSLTICTLVDPFTWLSKDRATSSNLHTAALCRCSPKDLPEAMDDREGWRERVRDILADSATWWWWNNQTVLFLTIQFSINHLFEHCLNVKQFNLTNRQDPIRCYHSGSEWTWK